MVQNIQYFQMVQKIAKDVKETWRDILVDLLQSMILCLIAVASIRWVAEPLLWLSISSVIIILLFGRLLITE